jgi:hypothetical protein
VDVLYTLRIIFIQDIYAFGRVSDLDRFGPIGRRSGISGTADVDGLNLKEQLVYRAGQRQLPYERNRHRAIMVWLKQPV